jgi:hypothetical protein
MPRTPKKYKIKTRRYAPKNAKLAGRTIDPITGDLLELYVVEDTAIVRIPQEELKQPEYWKPPHRRKNRARV